MSVIDDVATAGGEPIACCEDRFRPAATERGVWWRIGAVAVIAVNTMAVDLAINTSDASAPERLGGHLGALAAALLALALLGSPLAVGAARALHARRLTIEALFVLGVCGAFAASLVAMLRGVDAVYFEVVAILLVVYALGQQLCRSAERRALAGISAWAPAATTCTLLDDDGMTRSVAVSEIAVGNRVFVAAGSLIPIDGRVERGESFVREAEMTGEALPVARRAGDRVWAGTLAIDGALVVRAACRGSERRVDAIVAAVEAARARPASVQRQADRLIAWFLPVVGAVAVSTWLAWTAVAGWQVGLYNAMAVLLIACPCALGLATPVAVWNAIGRLAANGLIVRGGETIEGLANIDTVVFDKTGTITEIRPHFAGLALASGAPVDAAELREALAVIERGTSHPIAAAFATVTPTSDWRLERLRVLAGTGIEAEVSNAERGRPTVLQVGEPSRLLAPSQQQAWAALVRTAESAPSARVVAIVADEKLVAAASLGERVHDSWHAAHAALGERGLAVTVMTGDSAARAEIVGTSTVHAGLMPEGKLALVQEAQARGQHVLFVGDGINDAAAMAAADVSVAVGSGADLARELGDMLWIGRDLGVLAAAIDIARATRRGIRSNLWLAATYNLVGMTLAAIGALHPVVAAILMTCSSLIVTWRAAGFAQGDSPHDTAVAWPGASREAT